jgi:hypothetical protein
MAANKNVDVAALVAHYQQTGNAAETARHFGISRGTVSHHLDAAGLKGKPLHGGHLGSMVEVRSREVPKKGVRRYMLTCAQNNTTLNDTVWENLLALRAYYNAELLVSRFTYQKSMYAAYVKVNTAQASDFDDQWFDPRIDLYTCDHRVELAPGLVFCGEMNTLPTAARPLTGFETYTGRKSGIFPHVKVALDSIASVGDDPVKFNYTTGTVTKQNYLQKAAGLKASHHHCYGALLVEVDASGSWWVRQLTADSRGRIYDVGDRDDGAILVEAGKVTFGHRVEGINWGDIHVEERDPLTYETAWARGGMLDVLRPRYQFMHDTLSFRSRNHHELGNPHAMYERYVTGRDSVRDELGRVVEFLQRESYREWCKTIIVESNHCQALDRWLREADYRRDPVNAEMFLRLQARKYQAIREADDKFLLIEWACRELGLNRPGVRFLREDETFVICRDSGGGIECSMHGHRGIDGAKPTPLGLSRMGRRANTGHTHKAGIIDGLYTAGVSGRRRQGYNKGPSSWSDSDIVTYPNGKRAIITKWHGKWRAA